jgi:hypothetical protein
MILAGEPSLRILYIPFKLKHIYDHFYAERAREIALSRKGIAESFYAAMMSEVSETHANGQKNLENEIWD